MGQWCQAPATTVRTPPEGTGAWNFRDIPRDLMRMVKMAAAHEGKTVKEFLIELARIRIQELERKGNCRRASNARTLHHMPGRLRCPRQISAALPR